ncbi:MAG: MBL fold metallo-hydrolase [Hyphomicrobiales bacterium]|nr:MBL fold metallo-hydrolase [Hyphomicrobiales bacterium]
MLFGACNCLPGAQLLSDLGSLCAGGAGFVSAMVASMVANAQTGAARPLGRAVPEVDRLAVRIVTDNIVIQFVPSEQRDGLVIERRSAGNTVPDAPPRAALNGEWGLSMHAQSFRGGEERNVLVDFGYTSDVLLNNLSILKIDPAAFDALVLSHGHYDHFGGMVGFLTANRGRLKRDLPFFVGGEDAFCIRRNAGGNFGALDRRAIGESELQLMMAEGPAVVADHGFTTGRIAQTSFEKPLLPTREIVGIFDGFGCFPERMPPEKNIGDYVPDDFDHEIATSYLVKDRGLVVLTSCSHRGVINAVEQARRASGVEKVLAVIGGFHIVPPLGDDYIRDTIAAFQEIDPGYLIPAHCTGDRFYDLARAAMGDKVIHSAVGSRFIFGG